MRRRREEDSSRSQALSRFEDRFSSSQADPPLPRRHSLALTTFLAALDSTAVATALSTLQRELDGTAASLSWVTGAYLLMITACAPVYGKLSDVRLPFLTNLGRATWSEPG